MYSYAKVFCGNQASSWHGTTVQAVQPIPSLCEEDSATVTSSCGTPKPLCQCPTDNTEPMEDTTDTNPLQMRKRQSKFSPILKIQKRARTGTESCQSQSQSLEAQSYTCIHQPTCNNRPQRCAMHMCLSDFKPSSEEKKAINILQEEVYMYMFQKQVNITRPDGCVFLNIKEYYTGQLQQRGQQ